MKSRFTFRWENTKEAVHPTGWRQSPPDARRMVRMPQYAKILLRAGVL